MKNQQIRVKRLFTCLGFISLVFVSNNEELRARYSLLSNNDLEENSLIINNPQRRLPKEQRKLFEGNGWEILDSAQPAHNEPPPLCYSSTWLSMNVLVLDPKTVCV